MRIKVNLKPDTELVIPIAYRYCLQSAIYDTLRDTESFGSRHDEGYHNGTQKFKAFTFSDVFGHYRIKDGNIIFDDTCYFFVSSPEEELVLAVMSGFMRKGVKLLRQIITNVSIERVPDPAVGDEIIIKMISPICVKESIENTGKTQYYNPWDAKFGMLVSRNFVRKFAAITGTKPIGSINISPVLVESKCKKVMLYKGIIYEGWMGQYKVTGDPKYLRFLYDTGIGSENSKGFGMFKVVN